MNFDVLRLQILGVALLASLACALPGVFLVLRGTALLVDAISHAILFGIAVMFILVKTLHSPLLIMGATATGVLTAICVEYLITSHRIKKDAALGIIFPFFFSLGVVLISRYARNVHLDLDMVLLGEIAFAPFNRLYCYGIDCGPYALWVLGGLVIANILYFGVFFKEIVVTTFDYTLSGMLGLYPQRLHYILMIMTSVTIVLVFDVVGSIIVVALMIVPAATAYLVSVHVYEMLLLSCLGAAFSSCVGVFMAYSYDVSITGSIAVVTGIVFLITLLVAPEKGIIIQLYRKFFRILDISAVVMHEYVSTYTKVSLQEIAIFFSWNMIFAKLVVRYAVNKGLVRLCNETVVSLLPKNYSDKNIGGTL